MSVFNLISAPVISYFCCVDVWFGLFQLVFVFLFSQSEGCFDKTSFTIYIQTVSNSCRSLPSCGQNHYYYSSFFFNISTLKLFYDSSLNMGSIPIIIRIKCEHGSLNFDPFVLPHLLGGSTPHEVFQIGIK